MWRLVFLVAVVLAVGALGCTMTMTPKEHEHAYARQYDTETREMVDDIDSFWLADRPSRLTRWHVR